jgi:AraC family transcriptional regulator
MRDIGQAAARRHRSAPQPVIEGSRALTGAPPGLVLGGKYETFGSPLLRSSADLGWRGSVSAEVRRHRDLHCPPFQQPVNEVAIAIAGSAEVQRRADGPEQRFSLRPGEACICPRGVEVRYLHIEAGELDMLHLYLPLDLYGSLKATPGSPASALIYSGGIVDPLIHQVALTIAEELDTGGKDGQLLIDTLGMALAVRMLQRYSRPDDAHLTASFNDAERTRGLDSVRLKRVLDFMDSTLGEAVSLEAMSEVACLSMYHFCRAFKRSTGRSPYQYLSELRISRSKALLAQTDQTIETIAFSAGFSSGGNFARTFKKSVGLSPSLYRLRA